MNDSTPPAIVSLSFADQHGGPIPNAAGPYSLLVSAVDDDSLASAAIWARRLIDADRAAGTIDKYLRDWALFVHWLAGHRPNIDPCPAPPAALGLYIGALREAGLTKQTILGRVAAIVYVHDVAGFSPPTFDPTVKREIRGLRRQNDGARKGRAAIERSMATEMIKALPISSEQSRWKLRRDLRDRAIFALGWLSALRRSNIAALARSDVRIARDDLKHRRYLQIHVAASKTDQERRGRDMAVNELPPDEPLCAVRAIEAWLAETAGEIADDGPLFPAFNRSGRGFKPKAIGGADVAQVVKRLAALAGFTPETLAAHAMRRGFATSAINKGVGRAVVMKHGGWKSTAMLDRYTIVDDSRDNAVTDLFE